MGGPQHSEVVRKAVKTHPGRERLVYGAEGIDAFLNLGMPLRCSENCHVRVTFSPKQIETGKEGQVLRIKCSFLLPATGPLVNSLDGKRKD